MQNGKSKNCRSPYHKYGKKPYRYSDLYQHWRALVMKAGDPDDIAIADAKHRAAFGIREIGRVR